MEAEMIRTVIEGGAGVVALYLLAGVKHELGQLRGMLATLINQRMKGD